MIRIDPAGAVDIREIVARSTFAETPGACNTLKECMRLSSFAWVGKVDFRIACIYGVIAPTLLSERAYLWLLTTDLVDKHRFLFIRHSQIVVTEMLKNYPTLIGHVEYGAERSIKWLRLLGARLGEPHGLMIPFEIRAR